jgi:aerobic carbon-monoxide dehydrogenase medium subunit
MDEFEYASPSSIEEAVSLLADGRPAVVLGGGQCIVPEIRLGRRKPALLVDLRRLDELRAMPAAGGERGGRRLGAMITLDAVARNDGLVRSYAALAEAAAAVGDQQVRNRSTIGGGLINPRLGADLPPALVAHAAEVATFGVDGQRVVSVEMAMAGLPPGTVVTAICLPGTTAASGSAYEKFREPASCYAICGVAVSVVMADSGLVASCRVAVTGVAPGVVRLHELESALVGVTLSARRISSQLQAAAARLECTSDLAASGDYRCHLVGVLGERALGRALGRAGVSMS